MCSSDLVDVQGEGDAAEFSFRGEFRGDLVDLEKATDVSAVVETGDADGGFETEKAAQ